MQTQFNPDKEQIKKIVLSRLAFMIECAMEPELKQDFYNNPVPFMRRQGQKIPEDDEKLVVTVDPVKVRWPVVTVYFPRPVEMEGKLVCAAEYDEALDIQCTEEEHFKASKTSADHDFVEIDRAQVPEKFVNAITCFSGEGPVHKVKPKAGIKVTRHIPFAIEECYVHIVLPFVDVDHDILEDIQFDDAEIVLTSCS
jgi:hypothetical protein